ncbi:Palmitoyltransferase PFA4 [Suhomyces tanzawaensis NRRL Y-17324]|uniref:Palmitoyltransferase PFA4 n=1 Tax=Suhomyces tanzawaensis NRRL Y-17324 TaxID=984487 RepID=A0A1E4SIY0_9ASCO|nr:Palmitoyltransferase PFA4 [Suhomyces tanzawaensis NRRL Y-17324]ODV79459.1 Palmitoyltransferase PFA4 [Suhomyces tanzawaensis NRRL Y-17324]
MAVQLKWPILGVVIPCVLIAILGYGSHYFVFSSRLEPSTQAWFQFSLTMVWVSYALAIIIPPGLPPHNFEPKHGEWRRWCKKCQNYKPERAHHCKTCNVCVLQMDHHCPWTYNCVGHRNMGHFLRFLAWVLWTTGFAMVQLALVALQYYHDRALPSYLVDKRELVAVVFLLPVDVFVFLTILVLAIRCLINWVGRGMSQIEVWEWERIEHQFHTERMWSQINRNYLTLHGRKMPQLTSWNHLAVLLQMDEREAIAHEAGTAPVDELVVPPNFTPDDLVFPYDLGMWNNLTAILGYPWAWLMPWSEPSSSGYHPAKTKYLEDDQLNLPWPPDGGHQEQTAFVRDTCTDDIELSDYRNISLLKKRLDPRSTMERKKWVNDVGERLDDYGVDLEAEDPENEVLLVASDNRMDSD